MTIQDLQEFPLPDALTLLLYLHLRKSKAEVVITAEEWVALAKEVLADPGALKITYADDFSSVSVKVVPLEVALAGDSIH